MVELTTLGTLDLREPGTSVDASVLSQPKRLAVLLYLALAAPGGFVRRDTLLALFWPESDRARARNSLSQTLSMLRKGLGEDVVVTRGNEEVGLDPEWIRCDAVAFDEAVEAERFEEALELYKGDLAPGFHADASAEFEQWLEAERKRRRQASLDAARVLAGHAREAGRLQEAVAWARRARAIAPLSERAVRDLVEVLAAAGDRTAALDVFDTFADRLAMEYELEPSPELVERVQAVTEGSVESAAVDHAAVESQREPRGLPDSAHSERVRSTVGPSPSAQPPASPTSQSRVAPDTGLGGAPQRYGIILAVVGLLLVGAAGYVWGIRGPADDGEAEIRSVAVLPLESLASDPESEQYFADGMTEALTTELAQIGALTVKSHRSAMRYRATDRSIPQIARELGVEGLVEGSVLHDDEEVRITVQLVHGPTDRQLWSKSYRRDLRDILTLQAEVARTVAQELEITLTTSEEAQLTTNRVVQPEAYQLWLRGNFHLRRLTEESFRRALKLFEEALAVDPDYAAAHAGVANAYLHLWSWFASESSPDVLAKAKEAIERALRLDPATADAHLVNGFVQLWFEWQWTNADQAFQRAIELNPTLARAYLGRSHLLTVMGRTEAAIRMGRRALELDPLSAAAHFQLAHALDLANRQEEAMELYRAGLKAYPRSHQGHNLIADYHYARNREFDEAFSHLTRALEIAETPWTLGMLGYVYGKTDRTAQAHATMDRLTEGFSAQNIATALAFVHLGLDEHDEALRWLERGYQERDQAIIWLKEHWIFDPLRSDPRFQDLLRRMEYPGG